MIVVLTSIGCGATDAQGERPDHTLVTAAVPDRSIAATLANKGGPLFSSFDALGEPVLGALLTLRALVDQRTKLKARVHVTLVLPAGVALVEGVQEQWLEPSGQAVARELIFVVRIDVPPTEDAMLLVDVRADGFGYHAEHPYRFGRQNSLPLAPPRTGRELRVGAKRLGRSIPLLPKYRSPEVGDH